MATEYGLLLPHFGADAGRDKIIEGSRRAEQLGFDSVWVRDHLVRSEERRVGKECRL